MFYVSSIRVKGFWGKYTAEAEFFDDVSILIGKNGTGKTTFMDMLQAVLKVDLSQLYLLQFDEIVIKLKEKSKKRTISVHKDSSSERPYDVVNFKIGRQSFKVPLHPRDVDRYRVARPSRMTEGYLEIRKQVEGLVNVASLSVHRISNDDYEEEEVYRLPKRSHKPVVDKRIEHLSNALTTYQLSLAKKEEEVSSNFQKSVLTSMLFDVGFDTIDFLQASKTELKQEKRQLTRAYIDLGASDDDVRKKIDKHFKELNKSLANVQRFLNQKEDVNPGERYLLDLESLIPLPLLKRTQHVIDLSLKAEKEKQEISKPITQFLGIASEFMLDKQLNIESSTGKLLVTKDAKSIELLDLSSGEKQLLILLIETLLQKNQPFIFLADEPEISLHIEWQEKVISSIKKLNSSAQIIVATHSPEIAGGWMNQIIDMEDIIDG